MLAKLRSRLTFANVVSVIALFVALGGSGYAATKINGKNIKNNSISGRKLKARSITRDKIAKHTLTGTEINLSRLGTVPKADQAGTAGLAANATNAAHAGSADTAATAGNGARRVDFSGTRSDPAPADLPPSPAVHQVLTLDELTVRASCIDAGSGQGRLYVTFSASADGDLTWEDIRFSNPGITPESDGAALGPMSNANFAVIDITGGNRSVDGHSSSTAIPRTRSPSPCTAARATSIHSVMEAASWRALPWRLRARELPRARLASPIANGRKARSPAVRSRAWRA